MIILKSYLDAPKVIVGAGGAAWWILQGFTRNSIIIDGFVVTEEYGITETCGYPVFSPSSWSELPNSIGNYVAIIGIMNPDIDVDLLTSKLKDLGWSNVITFSQFAASLLEESGVNCAMLDPKIVLNREESLEEVRDMLEDSESKECLAHLISYVQNFADNALGIFPHPYFVSDLPRWDSRLRILDCGAFDGDTVKQAVQHGYEIEASVCFEPDKSNYAKLVANTPTSEKRLNLPVAVGDETKTIHFSAQSSSGSQVTKEGGTVVQCVAIDEILFDWSPNLIKMDIEGSEEKIIDQIIFDSMIFDFLAIEMDYLSLIPFFSLKRRIKAIATARQQLSNLSKLGYNLCHVENFNFFWRFAGHE
jgi:FkbM family methyltransferase